MKNTAPDYFTQLRNDYIPKVKDHANHSRHPFNPGDPNEFSYIPAATPNTSEAHTKSFTTTIS